jgi:hypothetical protein
MDEYSPWLRSHVRRGIDISISTAALPVAAVPIGIGALAFALETHQNPFFSQERLGKGGEWFKIFKLRTMRGGDHKTAGFGINDPRTTKVGAFLRRTRIDELPQLVNIIKGEMGLVGPRPMNAGQKQAMQESLGEKYPAFEADYTCCQPGACMPAEADVDLSPDLKTSHTANLAFARHTQEFAHDCSPGQYVRLLGSTALTVARDAMHSYLGSNEPDTASEPALSAVYSRL